MKYLYLKEKLESTVGRTVDSLVGGEPCKASASNCSGPTTSASSCARRTASSSTYGNDAAWSSFLTTRNKRVSQTPLQRPDKEQAVSR